MIQCLNEGRIRFSFSTGSLLVHAVSFADWLPAERDPVEHPAP